MNRENHICERLLVCGSCHVALLVELVSGHETCCLKSELFVSLYLREQMSSLLCHDFFFLHVKSDFLL